MTLLFLFNTQRFLVENTLKKYNLYYDIENTILDLDNNVTVSIKDLIQTVIK